MPLQLCSPTRRLSDHRKLKSHCASAASSGGEDLLLIKAARGDLVSRPPAWMMRQAGSRGKWEAFRPDGVIVFSDILTPLPAFGVPFDIEEVRGPVIHSPIRTEAWRNYNLSENLLGYCINRRTSCSIGFCQSSLDNCYFYSRRGEGTYTTIRSIFHTAPNLLRALLSHLAKAITEYIIFQVESGAHCIQIFDSWGGKLPPDMWEKWSKPYINEIVSIVKKTCPQTRLVLYINGNGGLLERMKETGVDVIGLDWTIDMSDGRKRLGSNISIQGNVDPAYLFSPLPALTEEIERVVKCAGKKGHILNLGHGVLVGTRKKFEV